MNKIKFLGVLILTLAIGFFCYAEMGDLWTGGWDYTNNTDYWAIEADGDLVPGTDSEVTIGASGTEIENIYLEAITLGGVEKTGWGSIISPMTDASSYVYPTDAGSTNLKLYDNGNITIVGTIDADGLTMENDATLTNASNNTVVLTENSGTLSFGFDGSDTLLSASVGSIELYPQVDATEGTVDFLTGGDTNDFLYIKTTSNVPIIATSGSCNLTIAPDGGTTNLTGNVIVSGTLTAGSLTGVTSWTFTTDGDTMSGGTDDHLILTSNNEDIVLQLLAPEDDNPVIHFIADNNADTGDEWKILVDYSAHDFEIYNEANQLMNIATSGNIDFPGAVSITMENDEYIGNASDGTIKLATNSGSMVVDIYSPDTSDGTAGLALSSDGAEDTGDRWLILATGSETLTIMNDTATVDVFTSGAFGLTIAGADGDITTMGDIEIVDDMDLVLGASAEWNIQYNDGADDQLLITTTKTSAIATTDPMFEILVDTGNNNGTSMVGNQQVFGIAKGSQGTNVPLLTLDEDGDLIIAGSLTQVGGSAFTQDDEVDGVVTAVTLVHSSSNNASSNDDGVAIVFNLETDTNVVEEFASLDVVAIDVSNGSEDADIVFSQYGAGVIQETLRLVAGDAAGASDYLQYTANTSQTNGIVDVMVLKLDTSATPANNLGAGISIQIDDATPGVEEQASIDFQVTDSTTDSENCDYILSLNTEGTIREVMKIDTDSTATDNTLFTLTSWTIQTNDIQDVLELVLDNTAETATTNFGLGISIVMEQDDSGTPVEQASIDFQMVDSTSTSEDCDIIFSQTTDGAVAETLRLVANNGTSGGDILKWTSNTGEANGIVDVMQIILSTSDTATTLGAAIAIYVEDGDDIEESASIDFVLTTATGNAEDLDIVFSQQSAGDIHETLRLVAADAADAADRMQYTANTSDTDIVHDILRLVIDSSGTPANGMGAGISIWVDDDGGTPEEQGSIDVRLTDATNGTEDADMIFSVMTNGTVAERVRIDADGANLLLIGTTPHIVIGDAGDEDTQINYDGSTVDFSHGIIDADDDWQLCLSTTLGTTERITVAGDSETITLGAGTGDVDTTLVWAGTAQNYYAGIDDGDDKLHIGLGVAPGTTVALKIDASQVADFQQTVVFTGGQTRKQIITGSHVAVGVSDPPTFAIIGTELQSMVKVWQFDADGGSNGDDTVYLTFNVPDGYITDSLRLNVGWSYSTAETNDDDVVFDMTVKIITQGTAAAGGDVWDAGGTAFTQGDTNLDAGDADEGKLIVTQLSPEVDTIAVDDTLLIMFWVDETASDLTASGTCDVHFFEMEWESTE